MSDETPRDDGDSIGIVISLATGNPMADGPGPTSKAEQRPPCSSHYQHGWVVDFNARTLKCQQCGAGLDPFEELARIARGFDAVRDAKKELRSMHKLLGSLDGEEKRIKARIRSAKKRNVDGAVAAERAKWVKRMQRTQGNARQIAELAKRIVRATDG